LGSERNAQAIEVEALKKEVESEVGKRTTGSVLRWNARLAEKVSAVKKLRKDQFKEDEQRDLPNLDRRGVEGAVEWQLRREAGIPEVDEKTDKDSPYSLQAIEEGLLTREAQNGVEYGIAWSAKGELIEISKGDKGSVGMTPNADAFRNGTFTHSHPTEEGDDKRPYGLAFSVGDINHHGHRYLAETRAVAIEGTYVFNCPAGTARLPENDFQTKSLRETKEYRDGSPDEKHRIAIRYAELMLEKVDPVNKAVGETIERLQREGKAVTESSVLRDKQFLQQQKDAVFKVLEAIGGKCTFIPNKGYEFINQPPSSMRFQRDVVKTEVVPTRPIVPKSSIIDKDGNTIRKVRPQSATEAVKKMAPPKKPTDLPTKQPPAPVTPRFRDPAPTPPPKPTPPKPVSPPPQVTGGSLRMGGAGIRRF
jgi:hypothetical protein